MIPLRISSWTAVLVLTFSATASAALLDDPCLELATGGTQTSNSAWALTVNFPDGVGPAAQFQTAPWAAQSGNTGLWFRSFEGAQQAGDPAADAELAQTVAASPGVYDLTFWVKYETSFSATSMFVELSSEVGDLTSFNLLMRTADGAFHQYSISNFVAGAATTSLTVRARHGGRGRGRGQSPVPLHR